MYGEKPESYNRFCLPEPTTYKFTIYFNHINNANNIGEIRYIVCRKLKNEFDTEVSVLEILWKGGDGSITVRVKSLQTFISMSELESIVTEVVDGTVGDVARTACVDTLP